MQKFLLNLLIAAAKDPDIQKFVLQLVEQLGTQLIIKLLPEIVGTFPAFGAALLKAVLAKLPIVGALPGDVADIAKDAVKNLIDSDPDIPGLSDIIDLSELARKWLNL